MSEFYNKQVGAGGCSYHTLSNYNQGYGAGAMAPVPSGTPSMSTVVVPQYSAPGYDALQHGVNSAQMCGNYFDIKSAYGSPKGCTQFAARLCS